MLDKIEVWRSRLVLPSPICNHVKWPMNVIQSTMVINCDFHTTYHFMWKPEKDERRGEWGVRTFFIVAHVRMLQIGIAMRAPGSIPHIICHHNHSFTSCLFFFIHLRLGPKRKPRGLLCPPIKNNSLDFYHSRIQSTHSFSNWIPRKLSSNHKKNQLYWYE